MSQVSCVPSYAIVTTLLSRDRDARIYRIYLPTHLPVYIATSIDAFLLFCLSL